MCKCANVEAFLESAHSSHESHHVGSSAVQLPRDMWIIWTSLRDTKSEQQFPR